MAIPQNLREKTSSCSSAKMKQWKPPKKEKLFRKKKLWASSYQTSSDYDHGGVDNLALPKSVKIKRATVDSLYLNLELQSSVMARAKEVEAKLSQSYPILIKVMLPSHVTGGFWLGLPRVFCNCHMPKEDITIVLENESGMKYETKYLCEKAGLSGGWRGFSMAHKLVQGDVVVFHLVKPTRFMVYIVRTNATVEVNAAHQSCKKQMPLCIIKERLISNIEEEMTRENVKNKEQNVVTVKKEENESPDSLMMDDHEEDKQTSSQVEMDTAEMMPRLDVSENDNKDFALCFMSGIQLSDSVPDFDRVKSSNDFRIFVNGLIIDSEFSQHIRTKYYELCCSQKSYLHDHLLEGLNYKLVSGIISETTNIADAIRASRITTSHEHLTTWDKTLKAFEGLGMNVGFLRSRIDQLLYISLKPEKKREAELKRDAMKSEVSTLKLKLFEARQTRQRLETEILSLDIDIYNMEILFQEVASAPW